MPILFFDDAPARIEVELCFLARVLLAKIEKLCFFEGTTSGEVVVDDFTEAERQIGEDVGGGEDFEYR
jgi:hypothetical protein